MIGSTKWCPGLSHTRFLLFTCTSCREGPTARTKLATESAKYASDQQNKTSVIAVDTFVSSVGMCPYLDCATEAHGPAPALGAQAPGYCMSAYICMSDSFRPGTITLNRPLCSTVRLRLQLMVRVQLHLEAADLFGLKTSRCENSHLYSSSNTACMKPSHRGTCWCKSAWLESTSSEFSACQRSFSLRSYTSAERARDCCCSASSAARARSRADAAWSSSS